MILPPSRLRSIDVLRGIAMVLMAVDHVRVYAGVPPGGPTPGIFFTRWITHFCAPTFVFLAGTSVFLLGRTLGDKKVLARFLVTRGLLLVLLELTVIRVLWTFNFDFAHYNLAGVIWMLGWCMVLLAGLIWLPVGALAAIGLVIIAGHNAVAPNEDAGWALQFLYFGGVVPLGTGGPPIAILYVIVPWIGVMAAGYAFGAVMTKPAAVRDKWCFTIGLAACVAFVLLRAADVYGDPRPWAAPVANMPAPLRFLNTSKYPASLAFLLMTLGPLIASLPAAESLQGRVSNAFAVFGRVPMFYYLLHIPVIHVAAILVSLAREGRVNPWLFANHPMWPPPVPDGYRWSLGLLYLVSFAVIALVYLPCRRFADLKAARTHRWMQYL